MKEIIEFYGIDSFNRPVFRSIRKKNFYGSVEKLFDFAGMTEKDILECVTEKDICFFGNSFDCEPMGTPAGDIEIFRGAK